MTAGVGNTIQASDYSSIKAKVDLVFGVGSGQTGYGQIVTSPSASLGSVIYASHWMALRSDMAKTRQHQIGGTIGTSTALDGNNLVSITNTTVITEAIRNQFNTFADTITTYKDAVHSSQLKAESLGSLTRTTLWTNTINHSSSITGASSGSGPSENIRYFFNSGGQIILSASRTGGTSSTKNSNWTSFLSGMGSITIDRNSTVGAVGTGSSIGWFNLTTSEQLVYQYSQGTDRSYKIYARKDSLSTTMILRMEFTDNYNSDPTMVDGTLVSSVNQNRPSGDVGNNVNVLTPTAVNSGLSESFVRNISWTNTTFTEPVADDGSVTGISTITLTNDMFVGTIGQSVPNVTYQNVPAGLTPVLIKQTINTATLSFTGNAINNANANDVSNLLVNFGTGSFSSGVAASITYAIDFRDPLPRSLAYSTTTFTESGANLGAVSGAATITLTNDTFLGTIGQAVPGTQILNVPTGLAASLIKATANTATLSFTGAATNHLASNSVSNITVIFGNSSFAYGLASAVTNATQAIAINFNDPPLRSIAYSTKVFNETPETISSTVTVVKSENYAYGTFVNTYGVWYPDLNLPTFDMTVPVTFPSSGNYVFTVGSDNMGIVYLDGNNVVQTPQTSDQSNYNNPLGFSSTVSVTAGIHQIRIYGTNTGGPGSIGVTIAPAASNPVNVFTSLQLINYNNAIQGNDGSIANTSTLTLTGDTFAGTIGQSVTGVTITNVPAGLTASVIKATSNTATLSFSGNATNHETINSVSNVTVSFSSSSFGYGYASLVTNSTVSDISVNFTSTQQRVLTYSATSFTENLVTNNGSFTDSISISLSNDSFLGSVGDAIPGVTMGTFPGMLTPSLVKVSNQLARLTLNGSATSHNASNNTTFQITFGNGSFAKGSASTVVDYTKTIGLNFYDRKTNVMFIIDISGSMGTYDVNIGGIVSGNNRLEAAKIICSNILTKLQAKGDVAASVITFENTALQRTNGFTSVYNATAAINALTLGSGTIISAGLDLAVQNWSQSGKLTGTGTRNLIYVITDLSDYAVTTVSSKTNISWSSFLVTNSITGYGLGISIINPITIDTLSWDGYTNVDTNGLIVTNLNQLAPPIVP